MAEFSEQVRQHGVHLEVTPGETPHALGKTERAGGLWKTVFKKVALQMQIAGALDVEVAASIVTQVRNETIRSHGYTPVQAVFGLRGTRVPA
eukprot:5793583-Amphidinium_carterae.1